MIVDSYLKDDKKLYKAGMIDRLALTLDNYADSKWGNRFYSEDFLRGFCEQRNRIHAQVGKATSSVVVLTTVLAFLDNLNGTVNLWGLTFSIPELGSLSLCVLISVCFIALVSAFINQLVIDRLLVTLGNRIGAFSFELVLLNFSAQNLWTLATTPKYHGLRSGNGHKRIQTIIGFAFLVIGLAFICYPVAIVSFVIFSTFSGDPDLVSYALSGITVCCFLFSFFLILAFSFKYNFEPATLAEPSEPFVPEDFIELGSPFKEPMNKQSETQN